MERETEMDTRKVMKKGGRKAIKRDGMQVIKWDLRLYKNRLTRQ
jgi:hypothetical protein